MKLVHYVRFSLILTVILSCAFFARAQSDSASLSGRVTDATGAVIPAATVTMTNQATGIVNTATTNGAGRYAFPALKAGTYDLNVTMAGFKQMTATGLVLNVQAVVAHDVVLPVSGTTQSVQVTGQERGADITTSSAVSTVIDRQFVENIPLNGRTIQNLIQLTPGVVAVAANNTGDDGQFSVNGQRADSNYFTVDGVSANIGAEAQAGVYTTNGANPGFTTTGATNNLVSVDAIQEFRIQTSTFAPEYGRTPGAQISITTRSGTNKFHGTAFEYFRNSVMDASNWFDGFLHLPKGVVRQNDFGGVLGGPIYRDKSFFFFSYEGARLSQPAPAISYVPDVNSRSIVPADLQPLLKAYPLPNVAQTPAEAAQGYAQFNFVQANTSKLNATSLRLDDNLTKTWSVFARYNYAPSTALVQGGGGPFGTPATVFNNLSDRTQTATGGTTKSFGANIVNETIFNWSRYNAQSAIPLKSVNGAVIPTIQQLIPASEGVTIPASQQSFETEFATIPVGILTVGPNASNIQRQINLVDNFTDQVGNHQLKFGIDWRRLTPFTRPLQYLNAPIFLGILGPFATVQSGQVLESITVATENVGLIFSNYSMYAQDTWQATPRFTLTYGIRYDLNPAISGQNVQLRGFVNPYDTANLVLAPAGTPLYKTQDANVGPRVGFSYRAHETPGHETIFRGGYGIFYDLGSSELGRAATQWPFLRYNIMGFGPFPLTPAAAAAKPFSLNPPYTGIATVDPNLVTPRTFEWNAAIEQGIGTNQSLTVTYLGALGRDLLRNVVLFPAGSSTQGSTVQTNGSKSNYNSLQVQYQRNLYKRVQALASYTYSHSIDTQSLNTGFNDTPPAEFNANLERASSDFDVRHAFSAAVTYNTPAANYRSFATALADGWALDGIFIARSATPVDLAAGTQIPVGGSNLEQRPNFVSGVPQFLHGSQYPGGQALNPAAFVAPTGLAAGDVPRNHFRGFSAEQLDVAMHRSFAIHNSLNLQFRAEVFNVINKANFANYDGVLTDPNFGQSTSTLNNYLGGAGEGLTSIYNIGGPRSIQVALRLSF